MASRNARDNKAAKTHYDDVSMFRFDSSFFYFSFVFRSRMISNSFFLFLCIGCSRESQWRSEEKKKHITAVRSISSQHSPLSLFRRFQFQFKLNIPIVSSATAINIFLRNFFLHEISIYSIFGCTFTCSGVRVVCARHLHRISINMCLKYRFTSTAN